MSKDSEGEPYMSRLVWASFPYFSLSRPNELFMIFFHSSFAIIMSVLSRHLFCAVPRRYADHLTIVGRVP